MIANLLYAASIALMPTSSSDLYDPTMNVSAVREIECDSWYGSGFQIADNVIATALHVAKGTGCKDMATGKHLLMYKSDPAHDFALMTGDLPKDKPYVKYSCARYVPGQDYLSYGISGYGWGYSHSNRFLRMYAITARDEITDDKFFLYGSLTPSPGMRVFNGKIAPGTSGGPIVDKKGFAHGVNNAGASFFGIPASPTFSYELADTILCHPPK